MVTWEEIVRQWEADPQKLLAWLISLMWQAGIKPSDQVVWFANKKDRIVEIGLRIIKEKLDK
jgi:hypothetical protein